MITCRKARVSRENIDIIRAGVFPRDQYHSIQEGQVISTSRLREGGHITVIHNEGKALFFSGESGNQGQERSVVGDWIDSVGMIILPPGRIMDIDGIEIR